MRLKNSRKRSGGALVEMAIIMPVVALLFFGLIVGAMGIFRYQEVAHLAREGARYASVRGYLYALENNTTAATPADVYNNAILPQVVCLDTNKINYTVTWNPSNQPFHMSADYEHPIANTVTVTVTYQWMPEWFLVGPINLTSSSTLTMSY